MNTQQLQLVTYEQAKRLKELGFNWKTWNFYLTGKFGLKNVEKELCEYSAHSNYNSYAGEYYSAPTVALALKWMRDIYKRHTSIYMVMHALSDNVYWAFDYQRKQHGDYNTYEAAELELLDELLTILEK